MEVSEWPTCKTTTKIIWVNHGDWLSQTVILCRCNNKNDQRLRGYYKTRYTFQNPSALITVPVAELRIDQNTGRQYYTTTNHTNAPLALGIGDTIHGRDLVAAGRINWTEE